MDVIAYDESISNEYFKDNESIDEEMKKFEMNDLEKILSTYKLRPVNKSTAGFSKIANQIQRISTERGFQLNMLIVGCNGLGKSSFVNNLFQTRFPESKQSGSINESLAFIMTENEVKLNVKLIEVPDFGEKINNSQSWKIIENYLDRCFAQHMYHEQQISRPPTCDSKDNLVHLCLYFVQPSSQDVCLKALDIEFLRSAHNKVNIVPLISKADSMTSDEIKMHKTHLLSELDAHGINYFKFTMPDDSGWRPDNVNLKYPDRRSIQNFINRFPFAVAAGNETVTVDNKQVTIRSYPWGSIQIDNLDHCDTFAARTLLLSTHLQELIEMTHGTMYENYRSAALEDMCIKMGIPSSNVYHPALYLENYFKRMDTVLINKINEMETGFQELVGKRQTALDKKTRDIENESLKMNEELNYLYRKFERDFSNFVSNKTDWTCTNYEYHETCGTLRVDKNGNIKPLSKALRKP